MLCNVVWDQVDTTVIRPDVQNKLPIESDVTYNLTLTEYDPLVCRRTLIDPPDTGTDRESDHQFKFGHTSPQVGPTLPSPV